MKIKITEPGWQGFSDVLSGVPFDKGVSAREVSRPEADAISAVIRVQIVDGGEDDCGVAERLVRGNTTRAEVAEQAKRAEQAELDAEREKRKKAAEEKAKELAGQLYTAEQLEAIADEKGITGLREIAKPLGVSDRSIAGLIREILKAQEA